MRILAFCNALALAHVTRALEVAKALTRRGHTILFAGHGTYLAVAEQAGYPVRALPYVTEERAFAAIKSQRLADLFPEKDAEAYVEADRALIAEWQPDLLLTDNRLSATVAAELAGIPLVSIVNVHMSSLRRIPFFSLRNALRRPDSAAVGEPLFRLADCIENRIEFQFYDRLMVAGLNRVRRRHGLRKRFGNTFEEGDLTLLPDVPEFSPVSRLPASARYVGPLTWHNDLPAPRCLREGRLDPGRPCVYLSLGSGGLAELLEESDRLADGSVQFVVATGKNRVPSLDRLPDNFFVEEYVNTDVLYGRSGGRRWADAIVCHGGNGTIYQALAAGVPVIGLATHEEQHYGLKRVNRLGLGIGFGRATHRRGGTGSVRGAIRQVLADPRYRENAARFARRMADYANGAELAAHMIENCLARTDRPCARNPVAKPAPLSLPVRKGA